MKEIYITPYTCKTIHKSIKNKQLTYKAISEMTGTSESTICRICKGKAKRININLAHKLEDILDISITDALQDTSELIKMIEDLEKENKILKQLLIKKWEE